MKTLASTALLHLLLSFLTTTVHALPSHTHTQTTQTADKHAPSAWQLSLYQNTHCTGEATFHAGNGTHPCAASILNGGAVAYIPVLGSNSTCKVVLFGDGGCSRAEMVGIVGCGGGEEEGDKERGKEEGGKKEGGKVKARKCEVPPGGGGGGGREIRSFRVVC